MRNRIILAILIWTAITMYFTLAPADYLPESDLWGYDKLGHFGIFGGWTFLTGLFLTTSNPKRPIPNLWIWLGGALFSSLIEFLQFALPINRTAEWGDVAANLIGVTTATCIIMLLRRIGMTTYIARE